MDIQQWLAETADRAAPEQSDDHRIPDAFRAHPLAQDREQQLGRTYRRKKRKRASSDSSIIAPRPTNRSRAQAPQRSLPSERGRSAESADRVSRHSAYSSPDASPSPEPAPEKTYERRARHKTRPDRYEPKQKKQEGGNDARKERKSRKKRRKSHRSGDGGRTAGLVQSFQLKNGPKNSRLTIKPGATAGLFKHGRASAQVTGRGGGLPDLVFNEMKFLQRPTEHQDAPPDPAEQQQRSKNDRKRANENEISAYFDAKRPAHKQREERNDAPHNRQNGGGDSHTTREVDRRRRSTPPVELPSRPFLGFGSKGGQPDGKERHSEHTSYFSWSQTPPNEPPPSRRRRITAPILDPGELSAKRPRAKPPDFRGQAKSSNVDLADQSHAARPRQKSHQGQWVQARRGKGAALVEVYQAPAEPVHRRIEERRSTTKTTSQSLPKVLHQRPSDHQSHFGDQTNDGYHTSDILKIQEQNVVSDKPRIEDHIPSDQVRPGKENQGPALSLSIDRLLDRARHLATVPADEPRHAAVDEGPITRDHREMGDHSADVQPAMSLPVRGEAAHTLVQHTRPLPAQQRLSSSVHASRRTASIPHGKRYLEDLMRPYTFHRHISAGHDPKTRQPEQLMQEDDEMLNDGQDLGPDISFQSPVNATVQQAEELAYGPRSYLAPAIYDAQSEHLVSEATSLWQRQECTPSIPLMGRSASIGRTLGSEQAAGPLSADGVDDMSGFWKPNRLY